MKRLCGRLALVIVTIAALAYVWNHYSGAKGGCSIASGAGVALARVVSAHFDERPHEWRCVYDSRGHAQLVADILTPAPIDSPAWVHGHRMIIVSEHPYDPAHTETVPMLLVAVGTVAGDTVGAAYFRDVDHGTVTGWITSNPQRMPHPPELAFSAQGWHAFPATAVLDERRLRALVTEYLETGRRPEHVGWQESEFIQ